MKYLRLFFFFILSFILIVVVFSWIAWPSREVREAGWTTVMADPHMADAGRTMPFDGGTIAPRLGLADIICDLVSSGSTLEANKLRAVETIFKSTAALIRNTRELNPEKAHALEIVLRRLDGVQKAADTKYIMLHAPKASLEQIKKLLPGSENPTILPLAGDDTKVALHAVCAESVFWETMESLKKAGASSILVLPIEKMML